ncbi:peptidase M23 [Burkholderia sp. WAC0059]|uniref:murein hydrolase activator EnvC family protein n=1 Tax=Burkholderia sp. WAC0059 TaxID=2066022 RepID=UPI000C7EA895|nr:peptidoglycan DD-metalloendopeptidase family protein [Burkholderia sp. WAC0059]PLZ04171.1 peptidase M23 [Burkholderia sp. WAC0059]
MNRQWRRLGAYPAWAAALLMSACTLTPWSGGTAPAGSMAAPAGYYRVNPGDSLASIAAAFGQRPQDLARWNQLENNAPVAAGEILRVAPPVATPPAATAQVALPPGSLAWPVRGPILQRFVPGQSTGILIGGTPGETVHAAAAGRVVYAGNGMAAYGPLVIIKHNDAVVTAYGHNGRLLVKQDDVVVQGQPIAEMGTDSHNVTGVQFEIRNDGKPVDPLSILPR